MASELFSESQKTQVTDAIARAERRSSGEIRVHIERKCQEDVLDHAAFIFKELKMHETADRNGVLIYMSFDDHKLAIIGDKNIHAHLGDTFWQDVKNFLIAEFKKESYVMGLTTAIDRIGIELERYFPIQPSDTNELSNKISFGDNI